MEPDERGLIEAARGGDAEAFGVLVLRYMPKALAFARRMTGSREDAEDLVQEAFVKTYRGLGSFKGGSSFYTWFYRVLANGCLDHLRRASFMKRIFWSRAADPDEPDAPDLAITNAPDLNPGASPEARARGTELRAAVDRALGGLSDRQRAVFLLRHDEGLKTAEVALALGISEGAVKAHLVRAVSALRRSLKEYGEHG